MREICPSAAIERKGSYLRQASANHGSAENEVDLIVYLQQVYASKPVKLVPPQLSSFWRSKMKFLAVLLEELRPSRIVVIFGATALRVGRVIADCARCGNALQTAPGEIVVYRKRPRGEVAFLSGTPRAVRGKWIVTKCVVVADILSQICRERTWLDSLIHAVIIVVPIVVVGQQH